MRSELDYLLSPAAIRERSARLFEACREGKTHFAYHPEKLGEVTAYVLGVIRAAYPTLKIPVHSRWGHFQVGGVDRIGQLEARLGSKDVAGRGRAKLDLVVVSVLLDAGAGTGWKYEERETGGSYSRSEGLAVASYRIFLEGAFSDDPSDPLKVTAQGLKRLERARLERGFQVSSSNPLVGLDGRLTLLRALGAALEARPELFPGGRPGGLLDRASAEVRAVQLLRWMLDGLGPIWPGRVSLGGVNLGDCWRHPLLGSGESPASLIPFHKLSQWLTYSLLEPLEETGVRVTGVDELTGLPEYRNGGLFLDRGLLSLRDPSQASREHEPGSELIVEWRALTIVLLDLVARELRNALGLREQEFPLAKALEGGTWRAGRQAAREQRPDGAPPLRIRSDGTVF